MKTVYIIPNIIPSFNASGGASVVATRLLSFLKLNIDVQLVNIHDVREVNNFDDQNLNVFFDEFHFLTEREVCILKSIFTNMIVLSLSNVPRKKDKIASFLFSIKEPVRYLYPLINNLTIVQFKNVIEKSSPHLIIAEHLVPALLANSILFRVPVIYCHHDWIYLLQKDKIRQADFSLKKLYDNMLLQFVEKKLVKKTDGVICVSAYEASQIKKNGIRSLYLPTLYPKNRKDISEKEEDKAIHLVHLGGMAATANRLGLENFIDKCWDKVKSEIPEIKLEIVGSLNHISENFKMKLKDNRIICHGFVGELSDVLLSSGINIIPWNKPTGGRTRIPLIFKHKQVLLSTVNAVKGSPEIKHLKNAYLVREVEDFPAAIQLLKNDRQLMIELANNGYATFEKYFSTDMEQSGLKSFLASVEKK